MVWMACVDDLLSSLMLTWEIIRLGAFRSPASMAARLILCKSLGTGAVLTKIFIRRRNRILVDVIKDADMLDILTTERLVKIIPLVESSRLYHLSCRSCFFNSNNYLITYLSKSSISSFQNSND
jgi:hypothetical protein